MSPRAESSSGSVGITVIWRSEKATNCLAPRAFTSLPRVDGLTAVLNSLSILEISPGFLVRISSRNPSRSRWQMRERLYRTRLGFGIFDLPVRLGAVPPLGRPFLVLLVIA